MKRILFFIILVISIIITGCQHSIKNTKKENENNQNLTQGSIEDKIKTINSIPKLNSNKILELVNSGSSMFHAVVEAGEGITDCKFPEEKYYTINGNDYKYFCSKIDTKEKLTIFLQTIFTERIRNKILDDLDLVVHNGKILTSGAGIGDGYDWGEAKINLINQNKNIAIVTFQVSLIIDSTKKNKIKLEFMYMKNVGWRINSNPEILY